MDYLGRKLRIPYNYFIEVLSAALLQAKTTPENTGHSPNRFLVFLSETDRNVRRQYEEHFITELTYDLENLIKQDSSNTISGVRVELHSSDKLLASELRIDCFFDDRFLFGNMVKWQGISNFIDASEHEWQGTELLQESSIEMPLILIVDDEPVLCAVLQRMLTKLKYQVVTAGNGFEALKILKKMTIDLVITDLRMPRMDGWELIQRIKKDEPDIPVVLISGYHSIYSRDMTETSMASGFISKPFSFLEIKSLLEQLLNNEKKLHSSAKSM
ncbi:DUF3662 domain-containing protein [bacterium]|nr:DUF3662 domain-containing protein [bacterium]